MSKIYVFVCIMISVAYSFNDLGIYGPQYNIVETNPMVYIKKAQKDFNKTKALQDIYHSYYRYMKVNLDLPICKKTQKRIFNPTIILTHNINMPKYHIFIKKGTKFNPLKYRSAKGYIMFINATNKAELLLAKRYAQESTIVVTKGNLDALTNIITSPVGLYKGNKEIIKAFKVKCTPSVYIQNNNKFIVMEYKTKDTKK